jgi:hypothetical protein
MAARKRSQEGLAFGINPGNGHYKLVVIDSTGKEIVSTVFPSMLAEAGAGVAGTMAAAKTVQWQGKAYWFGSPSAEFGHPLTGTSDVRLEDPVFLPALTRAAFAEAGLNGATHGYCVTGLPALQAGQEGKAAAIVQRLREATGDAFPGGKMEVLAEPVGMYMAAALNDNGEVADDRIVEGRVGLLDLGWRTADIGIVFKRRTEQQTLDTWSLGVIEPMKALRSSLAATFGVDLTLLETDRVAQQGHIDLAGEQIALPDGWDAPFIENGRLLASRLAERWETGRQFAAILVGGGGASIPQITDQIRERFPQARIIILDNPQMAIARGYARWARRQMRLAETAAE